jgi:uroporphyrinogen III methyltransferase/synthase
VALIRRCSWPDQRIIHCRLDEVAERVTPYSKFPPPAIAVVGRVAELTDSLSWFERRPLFGRRVMVTRPRHQSKQLSMALSELGADVVCQPAITISDPADWAAVDDALRRLSEFDYLVFSSSNGVRQLAKRLLDLGLDLRALGNVKLAAIGPGTSDALSHYHLRVDRQPGHEYRAESLVETLAEEAPGKRFLLARASRGREVLADGLRQNGAHVEQIVVYSSGDTEQPDPDLSAQLANGKIDWVTVTSSAIAESLVNLFGDQLKQSRLVSISPITSATLEKRGFKPDVEATTYSMEGMIAAILQDAK